MKKNLILSLVFAIPFAIYAALSGPGSGIVANYNFDQAGGSTLIDNSGNGNNGQITGTAIWTTGRNNGALSFNGTNSFVSVPNNTSINFGTGNFSVAGWVNLKTTAQMRIINKFDYSTLKGWIVDANTTPGFLRFRITDGVKNIDYSVQGSLGTNSWKFIAITVDRGANQAKLYVNGSQIGTTQNLAGIGNINNNAVLGIGTIPSTSGTWLNGTLDDFSIYNRALLPEEVTEYMNQNVTPPPVDTIAPTIPSNFVANAVSPTQANLSWGASTDNVSVLGYLISKDGVQVATTTTTSYSFNNLIEQTTYVFGVKSYDQVSNISQEAFATTTTPMVDRTPPSDPQNLTTNAVSFSQIDLSFTPSTDDVAIGGYKIYKNGVQIASISQSATTYSFTNLNASTTYTLGVSAFDTTNNNSQTTTIQATTQPLSTLSNGSQYLDWTKIDNGTAGVRTSSAIIWLPLEKKFLIIGGGYSNPIIGIPQPQQVQTFDVLTNTWQVVATTGTSPFSISNAISGAYTNFAGASEESNIPIQRYIYDQENGNVYTIFTNDISKIVMYKYNIATKAWTSVFVPLPPINPSPLTAPYYSDSVNPPYRVFMEGVSTIFDPVNREILFLGGRNGGARKGDFGEWAFNIDTKTWRSVNSYGSVLDPIRNQAWLAMDSIGNTENSARNIYYKNLSQSNEVSAIQGQTLTNLNTSISLINSLINSLNQASSTIAWENTATSRALVLANKANQNIQIAQSAISQGIVNPSILRVLFDTRRLLDETNGMLASSPDFREFPAVSYDENTKKIVLFGGDHGDYTLNDTWIYDTNTKKWTEIFPSVSPTPRTHASMTYVNGVGKIFLSGGVTMQTKFTYVYPNFDTPALENWLFDTNTMTWNLLSVGDQTFTNSPVISGPVASAENNLVFATGLKQSISDQGTLSSGSPSTWLRNVTDPGQITSITSQYGTTTNVRMYRTLTKEHDPRWIDESPRGDATTTASWIASLPPFSWIQAPIQPRPAAKREWGTAVFDAIRDNIYRITGGHQSDPGNEVTTYHPGINRYSIPYVPSIIGKGVDFNGRPDVVNHTYLNYAFDTVSGKLVYSSVAGTSVYDPDRGEWEDVVAQPFPGNLYYTKLASTPIGVVARDRRFFGWFNANTKIWSNFPIATSTIPAPTHGDDFLMTYDSTRNGLWMMSNTSYGVPNGKIWFYNMGANTITQYIPQAPSGTSFTMIREAVYLPTLDLVLLNNLAGNNQIAYDPTNNRFIKIPATKFANLNASTGNIGSYSIGLMYDPARKVAWAMSSEQMIFAMRVPDSYDTTLPSVPLNVAGQSISQGQVDLAWDNSTDNVGVNGYQVFRGSKQIATSTTATFSDTLQVSGTTQSYTIKAFDGNMNISASSTPVQVLVQ